MKNVYTAFALMFVIITGACNPSLNDPENDELQIYTSIYPIQFAVEQLVNDEINVISVYPPGVDAHSYEPTTREMLEIAHGKAFIYLADEMESFAESAKTALQTSDVQFVEVGQDKSLFRETETISDNRNEYYQTSNQFDPHIWFDPLRMIEMTEIIKNELINILPDYTDIFEENYIDLKNELTDLHELYETTLATKTERHIIVSHAAYGYWEDRYDITQISVSGLTSGDEPSQKDLANVIHLAEEHSIDHILFEQNASNRIATIIQNEINAERLYIHNLEVLVDEDIQNNEDYFSLMKKNLDTLNQAMK